MTTQMKLARTFGLSCILAAAPFATNACAMHENAGDTPVESVAAPAPVASTRLASARVDVDLGRNLSAARATLQALIADATLTPAEQADAIFLRAQAEEGLGDREAALTSIELLLEKYQDHAENARVRDWTKALRRLLGSREPQTSTAPDEGLTIAPVARTLAPYFPTQVGKETDVRILRIGGETKDSEALGTYRIASAMRDRQSKIVSSVAAPNVHSHDSHYGDWTGIPQSREQMRNALVVINYDGTDGKVPARYDAYLPLPAAEIDARLATGEGLIVVKERPGAPPVVLLAAPRIGQLAEVEKAFSQLTQLPKGELRVPVRKLLAPREIQTAMHGAFSQMSVCYNELLKRDQTAAGKVNFAFSIPADGHPISIVVTPDSTLTDAAATSCMKRQLEAVTFPATDIADALTVRYPITFSN
jgi:hypothetical protein